MNVVKNWRLISTLNVDTKIVSKAFALRLEKILPHIINGDQYAYAKGRSIFDAVRSIDDIMDFAKMNQLPGLMMAIDFEKDPVSLNFLLEALRCFNFGHSFIKWVSVFYSNVCLGDLFSFEMDTGAIACGPSLPVYTILGEVKKCFPWNNMSPKKFHSRVEPPLVLLHDTQIQT